MTAIPSDEKGFNQLDAVHGTVLFRLFYSFALDYFQTRLLK